VSVPGARGYETLSGRAGEENKTSRLLLINHSKFNVCFSLLLPGVMEATNERRTTIISCTTIHARSVSHLFNVQITYLSNLSDRMICSQQSLRDRVNGGEMRMYGAHQLRNIPLWGIVATLTRLL
jgi:hypothetical protein